MRKHAIDPAPPAPTEAPEDARAHQSPLTRPATVLPGWVPIAALSFLAVLAFLSRFVGLDASFWADEAYTAVEFVDPGPERIFFGPYAPNNHVLFNALTWITASGLGRSEAVYRLWSVLPALAAIAVVAWWVWNRFGRWPAVLVTALAVTSPVHLWLSKQARGYGLTFFAAAAMLVAAVRAGSGGRARDLRLFAGAGLVGIWTLPIFTPIFLGQATALMMRPALRRRVVRLVLIVGAASFFFYLPVLGELWSSSSQKAGGVLPWHSSITGPVSDLVEPSALMTLREGIVRHRAFEANHTIVQILLFAVFGLGALRLYRSRERLLLADIAFPVLITYGALTATRLHAWRPRFLSFMLLHVLVLLTLGLLELGRRVARSRSARYPFAVGCLLIAGVLLARFGDVVTAWNERPIENYKGASVVAEGTGLPRIFTNSTRTHGFWYYLGKERVERLPARELAKMFCEAPAPLAFIEHSFGAERVDLKCLRGRGAARVRVYQRERNLRMDVWILRADATPAFRPTALPDS